MTKFLDMPPGNDVCLLYSEMMKQAYKNRAAVIIPVKGGAYLYSARIEGKIPDGEGALRLSVRLGVRANHAAMCEGYEVAQA